MPAQKLCIPETHPPLRSPFGMQVWYDRHIEVDHTDLQKEVQSAADKGEFYGNWHVSGMQHMNRYLQKIMADGGQVGSRVHNKLKGDLQNNNFGGGKHVGSLPAYILMHGTYIPSGRESSQHKPWRNLQEAGVLIVPIPPNDCVNKRGLLAASP